MPAKDQNHLLGVLAAGVVLGHAWKPSGHADDVPLRCPACWGSGTAPVGLGHGTVVHVPSPVGVGNGTLAPRPPNVVLGPLCAAGAPAVGGTAFLWLDGVMTTVSMVDALGGAGRDAGSVGVLVRAASSISRPQIPAWLPKSMLGNVLAVGGTNVVGLADHGREDQGISPLPVGRGPTRLFVRVRVTVTRDLDKLCVIVAVHG